jgi:Tol biopolymer transport system component
MATASQRITGRRPLSAPQRTALLSVLAAAALVVLAVSGAEAKRALAPEAPYADFSPVVSPDGTRLAVLREGITPSLLVRLPSLYTARADGRGAVALTKGSAQSSSNAELGHFDEVASASWSPDGSRLVYAHAYQGTRYDYAHSELVIVDADGTNPYELTVTEPTAGFIRASTPSWSEARDQIVFAVEGGIDVINPDGSGLTELTHGTYDAYPVWSPDGSKIAFVEGKDQHLSLMNADGTGVRILSPLDSRQPAWSPDGLQVAFSAIENNSSDIYVVGADGFAQRRLTTDAAEDMTPAYTPDGQSILFGSSRGRGLYNGDLWIMNADGSNQHLLVPRAPKHASNGRTCTITGTVAADVLQGTTGGDVLCAFARGDRALGLAGNDVVEGGPGKDLIDGGAGNDVLLARDHRKDTVKGGPGFDRAQVDKGVDKVSGVEKILP